MVLLECLRLSMGSGMSLIGSLFGQDRGSDHKLYATDPNKNAE